MLSGRARGAYDPFVAASLDRFLTRAIIALAFLIFGLVGGYVLASRFPGVIPVEPAPNATKTAPTEPAPTEPAPTEPAPTEPAPTEPAPTEPAPTDAETSGETDGGAGETGGESGDVATGEPADGGDAGEIVVDPGPPPPLSGKFVIEIRDVVGTTRDKVVVRELATANAHQIEACLLAPGNLTAARLHYQLAVNASGDVVESLMLQGVEPSVDTCVADTLREWNWGPTSESSFFKVKFVWAA
jgi:hypothetical protein